MYTRTIMYRVAALIISAAMLSAAGFAFADTDLVLVSTSQTAANTLSATFTSPSGPRTVLIDLELKNLNEEKIVQAFYDNVTIDSAMHAFTIQIPNDLPVGIYHLSMGVFNPGWSGLQRWYYREREFLKVDPGPDTNTVTVGSSWKKTSSIPQGSTNDLFAYFFNHTDTTQTVILDREIHNLNAQKVSQAFSENTFPPGEGVIGGVSSLDNLPPGTYYLSVGIFDPGWSNLRQWFHRLQEFTVN